jgi:hypothetical protein
MRERYLKAVAVMAMLSASLPGAAQNAPRAPDHAQSTAPQLRDSRACAQGPGATLGQGTRTDREASAAPDSGAATLSDKLAQTDGVICPPNIDSEIKAPTPQGGPMLVIPPPGSPGGDQSVRPKWDRWHALQESSLN